MIDGIRRRQPGSHLHPADKHLADQMTVGDASKDKIPETFQPPQEVAAHEEQQPNNSTAGNLLPNDGSQGGKKKRRSFKEWFASLSKAKKIWLIVAAVVVLAGIVTGVYFLFFHDSKPAPVSQAKKAEPAAPPKPTTEPSRLTGVPVDPSSNLRPVTGIMIENSVDARPQSSLEQAGVVFEAVAEGGITRFLALYQESAPGYIGPVRSVRPYYLQWLLGFDAPVAHVGGSAEALLNIKQWGVKDLDQFANSAYYHRIGSRAAPHNVYTSMAELNDLETKKGYTSSKFNGFVRKAEEPSKAPTAKSIDFNVSSFYFNVHYDYDPVTNTYKRMEGGSPHMVVDQNGGQIQITPKVVIALVMAQGIASDGSHTAYATIGSGPVYIFQDGIVNIGTWHKAANTEQFTFTDGSGNTFGLDAGQTWLTALGGPERITYKP